MDFQVRLRPSRHQQQRRGQAVRRQGLPLGGVDPRPRPGRPVDPALRGQPWKGPTSGPSRPASLNRSPLTRPPWPLEWRMSGTAGADFRRWRRTPSTQPSPQHSLQPKRKPPVWRRHLPASSETPWWTRLGGRWPSFKVGPLLPLGMKVFWIWTLTDMMSNGGNFKNFLQGIPPLEEIPVRVTFQGTS